MPIQHSDHATYIGADEVARWFGVSAATVSQWRRRFGTGRNPCPQPDIQVGRFAGWRADRKAAWSAWNDRRADKRAAEAADYEAETVAYLSVKEVGEWFDKPAETVARWRSRYAGSATPCPEPDVVIQSETRSGPIPGWLPERRDEWVAWERSRPRSGGPRESASSGP